MPIYDFKCDSCGRLTEDVMVKEAMKYIICDTCSTRMHRMVGAPALDFVGPGFYKNDHYKMKLGVKDGKGKNI